MATDIDSAFYLGPLAWLIQFHSSRRRPHWFHLLDPCFAYHFQHFPRFRHRLCRNALSFISSSSSRPIVFTLFTRAGLSFLCFRHLPSASLPCASWTYSAMPGSILCVSLRFLCLGWRQTCIRPSISNVSGASINDSIVLDSSVIHMPSQIFFLAVVKQAWASIVVLSSRPRARRWLLCPACLLWALGFTCDTLSTMLSSFCSSAMFTMSPSCSMLLLAHSLAAYL